MKLLHTRDTVAIPVETLHAILGKFRQELHSELTADFEEKVTAVARPVVGRYPHNL